MVELEFFSGSTPPARCAVCGNPKVLRREVPVGIILSGQEPQIRIEDRCPTCNTTYDERRLVRHVPGVKTKKSNYWAREGRGYAKVSVPALPADRLPRTRGVNFQRQAIALFRERRQEMVTVSGGSEAQYNVLRPRDEDRQDASRARQELSRTMYPYQGTYVYHGAQSIRWRP